MMRSVGRRAQLDDQILVLGKVTVRVAREYSVEANPNYMRDVIAVLGLEDSRPVATPSVKRTPTTETLVGLENDKRAAYKTPVAKLLHMCQERADNMYSVKEAARKIICSTESDEMHMKRITRHLEGVPGAKCLIEIITLPQSVNVYADSDWASQPLTCKSTSGGVVRWRNATLSAKSRTQQSVSLSPAEAELYALATGIFEGVVTKHLANELGHEVTLVNHVDTQSARVWASKKKIRMYEAGDVERHVCARCR